MFWVGQVSEHKASQFPIWVSASHVFFFKDDAKLVGHWSLAELEKALPPHAPVKKRSIAHRLDGIHLEAQMPKGSIIDIIVAILRMLSPVLLASCISFNWVNITNCFPIFILLPKILMNAQVLK